MGQTEEFGLRPPDPAGETTNRAAQDTAGLTTGSGAAGTADDAPARDPGEEDGAGPGMSAGLAEETDRQRPVTGDAGVDAVLARLDELEGLPVTGHRAVFEDVHRRLRDVLGELDTGQPRETGDAAGAASRPGR